MTKLKIRRAALYTTVVCISDLIYVTDKETSNQFKSVDVEMLISYKIWIWINLDTFPNQWVDHSFQLILDKSYLIQNGFLQYILWQMLLSFSFFLKEIFCTPLSIKAGDKIMPKNRSCYLIAWVRYQYASTDTI